MRTLKDFYPILLRRYPIFPGTEIKETIYDPKEIIMLQEYFKCELNFSSSKNSNSNSNSSVNHQQVKQILIVPHRSFPKSTSSNDNTIPRLFTEWPGEQVGTLVDIAIQDGRANGTKSSVSLMIKGKEFRSCSGGFGSFANVEPSIVVRFTALDIRARLKEPMRQDIGYWRSYVENSFEDDYSNLTSQTIWNEMEDRLMQLKKYLCHVQQMKKPLAYSAAENVIIDQLSSNIVDKVKLGQGDVFNNNNSSSSPNPNPNSNINSNSNSNLLIAADGTCKSFLKEMKVLANLSFAYSRLLAGPFLSIALEKYDCNRLFHKLLITRCPIERIRMLSEIYSDLTDDCNIK